MKKYNLLIVALSIALLPNISYTRQRKLMLNDKAKLYDTMEDIIKMLKKDITPQNIETQKNRAKIQRKLRKYEKDLHSKTQMLTKNKKDFPSVYQDIHTIFFMLEQCLEYKYELLKGFSKTVDNSFKMTLAVIKKKLENLTPVEGEITQKFIDNALGKSVEAVEEAYRLILGFYGVNY